MLILWGRGTGGVVRWGRGALLYPLCPGSLSWNRELRAPPTHPLTLHPLPCPPLVQQFPSGLKYQCVGHPAQVSGLVSSTPAPLHLPHLQQCVLQFYKADLSHQFFRSLQRTVLSQAYSSGVYLDNHIHLRPQPATLTASNSPVQRLQAEPRYLSQSVSHNFLQHT